VASANVDLVRSIYTAWERGDFSSAEWAHPEIEYEVVDGPRPGSWTGLVGMAEASRDVLSAWEVYRAVADELRELDNERVLVLSHFRGRGKSSSPPKTERDRLGRGRSRRAVAEVVAGRLRL
jgi:ketosteroid isomerase-like protein